MHILLIHQVFATIQEAGGTRHYELGKYLVQKGHKITVITSSVNYLSGTKRNNRKEYFEGMDIIYSRHYSSLHKTFLQRGLSFISFFIFSFFDALKVKNVDIVWGTSPPLFQALTGLAVAKIKKAIFIFEVRDLWIDFAEQLKIIKNKMVINGLKMLEGIIYKNADAILVNSPGFIPFLTPIINMKKVYLIPNGVESNDFEVPLEKGQEFRKKYSLSDNFIIMYIGNIGIANDIQTILEAAFKLKGYQNIKFVLVGGGIKLNEYKNKIEQEGIGNIVIIGPQPKRAVPAMLSAADVCIATLRNVPFLNITFPNKVFDYMASGKPIVLAIGGVISEVIEKAQAGICVESGNSEEVVSAILNYYKNVELRKIHGENGRRYVKKEFERNIIASKLEQIFVEYYKKNGYDKK